MKNFIKEFKEFAIRGNVIDLAVGLLIGGAFGKIVSSLVNDILMPLVGSILGKNFSDMYGTINGATIKYGIFIQTIVDFLIIAFVIFMFIKAMNKLKKNKPVEEEDSMTNEEKLLVEIRDLLKNK